MSAVTSTPVADYLDRVAARIEKKGAWTRGASSKTSAGDYCHPTAPKAAMWCLYGAMVKEADHNPEAGIINEDFQPIFIAAENVLINIIKRRGSEFAIFRDVVNFNDYLGRTQEQVVSVVKEAAQTARRYKR